MPANTVSIYGEVHMTIVTDDRLETQLKELWAAYISYIDQNGRDKKAEALRSKYFLLYQNYRRNRKWRKIM